MHKAIQIRHDQKRGCGWRQPGGTYLCAGGIGRPCGKLPVPLDICPTCSGGIKPSRGWTWVNGTALIAERKCTSGKSECAGCPLGGPIGRVGLLWIGEKFYETPEDWMKECHEQGVSRRISAVPKDFKCGETWILIAHRKCIRNPDDTYTPGVFHVFKPACVEYVVKGDETDEEIEAMVKRGLTPVKVERVMDEADKFLDDLEEVE